ncbi:MAG: universal stress protein [Candidatus Eisenbacteria bacterium]|nr:universal stress protein [Candidatus Eisenbacteria bacterium]
MKILLALDTTAIASETIATLERMFAPADSSVVVLSVVGDNDAEVVPSPVLLASVAQNLAVIEADHVRTHEERVTRAVKELRTAGFEASGDVRYGDPRHAIVEAAQAHAADLVVIGCHERSSVRRLLMGSVASHVASHAPCNVLVVRHAE